MAKGMHPVDITAAVHKSGTTMNQLALDNGLSESACRMANIFRCCPIADPIIAQQIKKSLHAIWPNSYDENGRRIDDGHCQKDKAA